MQVIFWLHRLKVVLPSRQVVGCTRESTKDTAEERQAEAIRVPDRADRLAKQRRLSAHCAGKSVISYNSTLRRSDRWRADQTVRAGVPLALSGTGSIVDLARSTSLFGGATAVSGLALLALM